MDAASAIYEAAPLPLKGLVFAPGQALDAWPAYFNTLSCA